jgi:hypothetical protein
MKIIAPILPLTLALAGCNVAATNFAGTYTGTLTETYTCASSSPAPFPLTETFTVTQLGSDVFVSVGSCSGQSIGGDSSGNTVSLTPSSQTTSPCPQQSGGADPVAINVTGISGGTLTLGGENALQVSLTQNAMIAGNADACTGTATGTLALQ